MSAPDATLARDARTAAHELTRHHVPTIEQIESIGAVRQASEDLIRTILLTGGRSNDALKAVELARSAMMFAIAAIVVPFELAT